ncbi:MAG: BREX system ATP-binding domain-containing protein [Desulfomonilaceae bacterium]
MKNGWQTVRGLKDWLKKIFESGSPLKVGAIVFHPSYGEGTILWIQGIGAHARVCVDFGFAQPIVSLSELSLEREPSVAPESAPTTPPPTESKPGDTHEEKEPVVFSPSPEFAAEKMWALPTQMNQTEVEARRGVVALRLGQVLESQIAYLSVGTAELEQKFKRAISKTVVEGPTFLLVDAPWGVGKTHALTLLQVLAQEAKFATSYVVMDGVSTSLALPMELLSELMSSLRFPGNAKTTNLSHQIARAKQDERIEMLEQRGAEYLANTLIPFPLDAFDDPEVLDILTDFLSLRLSATEANTKLQKLNYSVRLKSIKARAISDRVPRFVQLLDEWGVFASVMGCSGLLVVLDELDVEYAASAYDTKADSDTIERRRKLLTELLKLTETPVMIAFAAAPGDPTLDEAHDPVKDIIGRLEGKVEHIKAPTPNQDDLRLLLDRLLDLYADAYSIEKVHLKQGASEALFQQLFHNHSANPSAVTRRFVRSAIERMDLMFGRFPQGGEADSSQQ